MCPGAPYRVGCTKGWIKATDTIEFERAKYAQELRHVGAAVRLLKERAHLMAAAFAGWQDMDYLGRGGCVWHRLAIAAGGDACAFLSPQLRGE
ncbi:hypothetical protein CYMTET_35441 [Cymbomonas tetramitiformis]|uniref:Uncharacterized protein n=1 Tax=Cymbomonas tetramitiformis TaxID=36881 RepID=A0AAE0F963_9CHLO|nr:hypothetical protein CYMTET_35441 [Cymbomonas tetramitiformis]